MSYIGTDVEVVTFNTATTFDVTGSITVGGTVDGRDVAADGTKLDTITSGAIANLLEDTTPQLGGNLDLNTNNVIGTGNINVIGSITGTSFVSTGDMSFTNNSKAIFGTSPSLEIYHDGSNSILDDVGAGNFKMQLAGADKLEITSAGVSVTGTVAATAFSGDGSALTGIPTPTLTSLGIPNHDDLTVDSSGNLDVTGTLGISGQATFGNDVVVSNDAYLYSSAGGSGVRAGLFLDGTNQVVKGFTAGSERLRIDSGGNLLVGGTSLGENGAVTMSGDGRIYAIRASDTAGFFGRTSTDGSIVNFTKDGTTVGSIGNGGTAAYIALNAHATSGVGLFGSVSNGGSLLPTNGSGTATDNAKNLGRSDYRFKDLYLSGTANVGNLQTISSGRIYSGTGGNASSPMIANVSDTDTGIHFPAADTMALGTGGATRLNIDSSGRVTMPYQPMSSHSCAVGNTADQVLPASSVQVNNGGHLSTSTNSGRFTAPVNGYYKCIFTGFSNYSGGYGYVNLRKNGAQQGYSIHWNHSGYTIHSGVSLNQVVYCSANDYLAFHSFGGSSWIQAGTVTFELIG